MNGPGSVRLVAQEKPAPRDHDRVAEAVERLAPWDRLLHGIGRVAQAQVRLEIRLRQVHTLLAMPSPGAARLASSRRGVAQLVDDCKVMLDGAGLSDDLTEAARSALKSAKGADEKRHRVVHDWWTHRLSDEPGSVTFERHQLTRGSAGVHQVEASDLDFVWGVEQALLHVEIRLNSLAFALTNSFLDERGAHLVAGPDHRQLLQEIEGQFTLLPDGSYRMRDPVEPDAQA